MSKPTDRRIIEIADYLWSDPGLKAAEVTSHFAVKFRLTERRVQTLLAKAKEYNIERQNKALNKRDEVLVQKEVDALKTQIVTREKVIAKLADIALNDEKILTKIKDGVEVKEVIRRKESDQIAAAKEILEVEGWKSAVKTESSITINGIDKPVEKMTDHELREFIKEDLRAN